ncbi:MAG: peroxidase, partial [Mycobacterium sp.]|nr:peroxidase [Mycobacterium sp.]
DALFNTARLINAALIAKIHTTEWTPAILGHPVLQTGSQANWYGLAGKQVKRLFGRLSSGDLLSGIPGSRTAHYGVPYSITEEFVDVYRMHALMPDDYVLLDLAGRAPEPMEFEAIHGVVNSRAILLEFGASNALYSLGVANPGAITLHNSPRFMYQFIRTDGFPIDLNAIDIVRSRERGIPRYNEFRRLLRLRPATGFADISGGHEATANQLRDIYGNIEEVDTMVGLYGERVPRGFGFSDTAFRIFALMAARRLESDRFFTKDFTPDVYTPEGMSWIDDNDMISVLRRHYPELGPMLAQQRNAFAPWPAVG